MKKNLLTGLLGICLTLFLFARPFVIYAQSGPTGTPTATPTPTISSGIGLGSAAPTGTYVEDQEVTFIGKNAARAGLLLDWTLSASNSGWLYLQPDSNGQPMPNPLKDFWFQIAFLIVAPLLIFIVLIAAFILIVTRGRNFTIRQFMIRFIIIVLLWYFSWSIIQIIYNLADIIQLFFLQSPTYKPDNISEKDLLSVAWPYATFVGLRLADPTSTESAFIALLLVKLTAITYYVMVGILWLRKIILWFFIILSPIYPLLLFFRPVRNTAKIWAGEFFRWVLYAPLFAILLAGLVHIWVNYIPMNFTAYQHTSEITGTHYMTNDVISKDPSTLTSDQASDYFPTAINILIGAPKQQVGLNNSVNYVETFAEYVVALLMLWVVILLPFILLQIFLDYFNSISITDNTWVQQFLARTTLRNTPPPTSPSAPPPAGYQPAGLAKQLPRYQPAGIAKSLPFGASFKMPERITEVLQSQKPARITQKASTEILQLTNLAVPTMRDIARYETSVLSNKKTTQMESQRVEQTLQHIADPTSAVGSQQETYKQIRSKLVNESQRGNPLAATILQAAASTAGTSLSPKKTTAVSRAMNSLFNPNQAVTAGERIKATQLRQFIVQESEKGNSTATKVVASMNEINKTEIINTQHLLQKLANPNAIPNVSQQMMFRQLRDELMEASKNGDEFASSVMSAVNSLPVTNPDLMLAMKIREQLQQESKKGNKLANELVAASESDTILTQVGELLKSLENAKQKGDPVALKVLELFGQQGIGTVAMTTNLPAANRIQTVSIEDYEGVRHMWSENYQNMEVPQNVDGTTPDRVAWLQTDVKAIDETIGLLSSSNAEEVSQGMQHVSGILPFLLIGGFSQNEIVAYLKAKRQAAKEVLENLHKNEEEEETQLPTKSSTEHATEHQEKAMTIDLPEEKNSV